MSSKDSITVRLHTPSGHYRVHRNGCYIGGFYPSSNSTIDGYRLNEVGRETEFYPSKTAVVDELIKEATAVYPTIQYL